MAMRTKLVPILVLALGLTAIAAITLLQRGSDRSRDAELMLAGVRVDLNRLQNAPFEASPTTGGSPERAAAVMSSTKARIWAALDELEQDSPPGELREVPPILRDNLTTLDGIYAIGVTGGYGPAADRLAGEAAGSQDEIVALLKGAEHDYERRAEAAQFQATLGSAAAILVLLLAFGLLYRRAARARATAEELARENERLLGASREEALSDALTGLRNRRALLADLDSAIAAAERRPLILALYDLDGFKQYNDTFGHPAGDGLLVRLAQRLQASVTGRSRAYRMGGDEFCVLVPAGPDAGEAAVRAAADALTEAGEAFTIGCSYGVAYVPAETSEAAEALRLADQRMYENKADRSSASRQSTDVLLKVLNERSPCLSEHLDGVARLAEATAGRLGLPGHEVKRVRLAAELHDIGKAAIPDDILDKPTKLDEREWEFIRQHTLIGERIVRAAPSLAHTAKLIRSSHERFDGGGYPDGLSGDEIPLGASIVAVCDAFDAMRSARPYRAAVSTAEALAELRRCSGAQFHPDVVEAFCELAEEPGSVVVGLPSQDLVRPVELLEQNDPSQLMRQRHRPE